MARIAVRWLAVISLALFSLGAARSGNWERLGRLEVAWPADHDVLSVPHNVGPLREIRLEARGGSVEIRDATVTFEDGTKIKPGFPNRVSERSGGQAVTLSGKRRRIRQIEFTYTPTRNKQNVQLTVYGR